MSSRGTNHGKAKPKTREVSPEERGSSLRSFKNSTSLTKFQSERSYSPEREKQSLNTNYKTLQSYNQVQEIVGKNSPLELMPMQDLIKLGTSLINQFDKDLQAR